MNDSTKYDEEIAKTLSAYDDDVELQGNPFLLTRIQELRKQKKNAGVVKKKVILRANLVLTALVILVNAATLYFYFNVNEQTNARQRLIIDLKEEFQVEQSQNEL